VASVTVTLRRSKKVALGWSDTVITRTDLQTAKESLLEEKVSVEKTISLLKGAMSPDVEDGADSVNPFSLLGVKKTKKGKNLLSLSEIQKQEEISKELALKQAESSKLDKLLVLIGKTEDHASSTISARLNAGWAAFRSENPDVTREAFEVSSKALLLREECFMPKLSLPVTGINVVHKCGPHFLPENDFGVFAQFLDRHPVDPFWYAPQHAIKDGKVQPLTQEAQSWLVKNQIVKPKVSGLSPSEKEKVAWRWLIISHNSKFPLKRVAIDKRLSLSYERRSKLRPEAASGNLDNAKITQELLSSFRSIMEGKLSERPLEGKVLIEESSMDNFLTASHELIRWISSTYSTYSPDAGFRLKDDKGQFKSNVKRLNAWLELADTFSKEKEVPANPLGEFDWDEVVMPEIPSPQPPSPAIDCDAGAGHPDLEPPESFFEDDVDWFREDVDILEIQEGQVYMTKMRQGVLYNGVQATKPPASKSQKEVKGKAKALLVSPQVPKESPKGTSGKGGAPEKPKSPLEEENPLRVKGVAKSKALSEAQRVALRKFFELKDERIPADEWESMDNRQRAAAMKARSIPRWASAAVLKRDSNLEDILEGKLTKDTVGDALSASLPKQKGGSSQALEAWQKLKSDFEGVTLYRTPQTGKEKALKKRFDQLVSDYGQQKCFPKPKDHPSLQGGRSSGTGRGGTPGGELAGLIQMATAFGQIAKAFKS
jgi:hypothetical protein